jgi:UDP-N-acetylglucosamine 2-epimerase (non-hydrolysing)
MKILTVFGTRPEAIKMAPIVLALAKEDGIDSKLCVTAQHRQMLDQVLDMFDLKPDYDLDLMRPGQELCGLTASIMVNLCEVFDDFRPDIVLVHGDTTTCFAASLTAFYKKIPVGHVEAGLRSGNLSSPWPEEANRILVSKLAQWHFAPTERNRVALTNEGVDPRNVYVTGNTVIDSLHIITERIQTSEKLRVDIDDELACSGLKLDVKKNKFILVTGHRRENFGDGLEGICEALKYLAQKNPDIHIVYPVHMNPNVRVPVLKSLTGCKNIQLIEPLGYAAFVFLMQHCYFVLTDSGGIQEEAPGLGKPVLVMRENTERPEAVEAGTVRLVGANAASIFKAAQDVIQNTSTYSDMSQAHNPYGDGKATSRILAKIREFGL